jgi:hypothetical protein
MPHLLPQALCLTRAHTHTSQSQRPRRACAYGTGRVADPGDAHGAHVLAEGRVDGIDVVHRLVLKARQQLAHPIAHIVPAHDAPVSTTAARTAQSSRHTRTCTHPHAHTTQTYACTHAHTHSMYTHAQAARSTYGVKSQYWRTWAGTTAVPPLWHAAQHQMPRTEHRRGRAPTGPPHAPHVSGTSAGRLASVNGTWVKRGGRKTGTASSVPGGATDSSGGRGNGACTDGPGWEREGAGGGDDGAAASCVVPPATMLLPVAVARHSSQTGHAAPWGSGSPTVFSRSVCWLCAAQTTSPHLSI